MGGREKQSGSQMKWSDNAGERRKISLYFSKRKEHVRLSYERAQVSVNKHAMRFIMPSSYAHGAPSPSHPENNNDTVN